MLKQMVRLWHSTQTVSPAALRIQYAKYVFSSYAESDTGNLGFVLFDG